MLTEVTSTSVINMCNELKFGLLEFLLLMSVFIIFAQFMLSSGNSVTLQYFFTVIQHLFYFAAVIMMLDFLIGN